MGRFLPVHLAAVLSLLSGTMLMPLMSTPAHAQGAARTFTWTGSGGTAWETNGNWDSNLYADSPTTAVSFLTGVANALALLGSDHSVYGISFNYNAVKTATSFTISGSGSDNTLNIYGGISNATALTQTIDARIALRASQSFTTVSGGTLSFTAGPYNRIDLLGNTLTVDGAGSTTIASPISSTATGGLIKNGSGTLTLTGNNSASFAGNMTINRGNVNVGGTLGTGTVTLTAPAAGGSGQLNFANAASAGNARIVNGTSVTFNNNSTAATSTITNSSVLLFNDSATAGSATITNTGQISFFGNANAGTASITNSGQISFFGNANAANASIINDSTGNNSTTGIAPLIDISGAANGSTIALGVLSGDGTVALGYNTLQVGGNSTATGFSGVLQGAGSLEKVGTSVLILSGANTFTGNTTLTGGSLRLGNSLALQNSTVVYDSPGTLLSFGANLTAVTLGGLQGRQNLNLVNTSGQGVALSVGANSGANLSSGVISGANGSLTKIGSGSLTLTGNNTYTGKTTITGGTLLVSSTTALGSQGIRGLNLNNGTSGGLFGFTVGNYTLLQDFTLAGSGSGFVAVNAADTLRVASTLSGSGSLTTGGAGTVVLSGNNTYTGGTTVLGGSTLNPGSSNALGSGPLTLSSGATLGINSGVNLTLGSLTSVSGSQITLGSGGALTLNPAAKTSILIAGTIFGTGSLIQNGGGMTTLSGNNTYSGGTDLRAGILGLTNANGIGTGTLTISGGATFLVPFNSGIATVNNNIAIGTGGGVIATDVSELAHQPQQTNVTLSGSLFGTGALELQGNDSIDSIITLTGANSYTGDITIGLVDLRVGDAAQSSSIGTGLVTTSRVSNSYLGFYNASSASSLRIDNGGNLDFYNNSSAGSAQIVNRGFGMQFHDNSTAGSAAISNSATLNFLNNSSAGSAVIDNHYAVDDILSSGSIIKFSGTATGSNATISNTGLVIVNTSTSIGSVSGSGNITIQGGQTLTLGALNKNDTISGKIGYGGSLVKTGTGTLTLTGANTYTGTTTVNYGGSLNVGDNTAKLSSSLGDGTGGVTNNGGLYFHYQSSAGSAQITNNQGMVFYDNTTAGTATITNNSYLYFLDNSVGSTARIINNANSGNGHLDLSGYTGTNGVSLGSVSGDGIVQLGNKIVTIGNLNTSTAISGTIQDGGYNSGTGGKIVKAGTGILTLTGANTYTGGTTVSQGTLAARGSALGTGAVTVASSATLAVGEAANTSLIPQATGTLTLSSLSVTLGSQTPILTFNLGNSGVSDKLLMTSATKPLGFSSAVSGSDDFVIGFSSATGSSLGAGTYTLFSFAAAQAQGVLPSVSSYKAHPAGNLGSLVTDSSAFGYVTDGNGMVTGLAFTIDGAQVVNTPEPGALALIVFALPLPITLLVRRRRQE